MPQEYEEVGSTVNYQLSIIVAGQDWVPREVINNPKSALKAFRELKEKGYEPKASRTIIYNSTVSGCRTEPSISEPLDLEKLEKMVREGDISNPIAFVPIPEHPEATGLEA